MTPRLGQRVTLLFPLNSRTQRVTGVVVELFDDVLESDTATIRIPSVTIRRDGDPSEDVWQAPLYRCVEAR